MREPAADRGQRHLSEDSGTTKHRSAGWPAGEVDIPHDNSTVRCYVLCYVTVSSTWYITSQGAHDILLTKGCAYFNSTKNIYLLVFQPYSKHITSWVAFQHSRLAGTHGKSGQATGKCYRYIFKLHIAIKSETEEVPGKKERSSGWLNFISNIVYINVLLLLE